jgi:hypothetical protein
VSEAQNAAAEALRTMRRTTDPPRQIAPSQPTPGMRGLSSGASVPDHRIPQQRALDALRLHYQWDR